PAVVGRDAAPARARPGQPPAGPRAALPPALDLDPRPGAGAERAVGRARRRAAGQTLPAAGHLGGVRLRVRPLPAGPWGGPVPPEPAHVLAADGGPDEPFRHRRPAGLRGEADAHQHAPARPRDAERCYLRRGGPGAGRPRTARGRADGGGPAGLVL